ncbi:hypothetical protein MUB18_15660 [Sphingobacterium sp. PCS056]|uniref:hypothetical protein n=1 Tax=Sphingobacterium sp. PCS056 TaxID=2931400 RepID=UPI00200E26D1|nr:hypothetical protein [Sphingobacterium sp. PCS056]UPZ35539.1 hypothetical protein MUB18_15660 [Sphingobacterium sp. PCS056]
MQIISPQYEVRYDIYNKIIIENWPKAVFREMTDLESIKKFYNDCYNSLKLELENELSKFHPAAWIREAYIQLELWTVIHYDDPAENVIGNKIFSPIGRYGWRYIIDICLEKLETNTIHNQERPTTENINVIFTLLVAMGQCSEYSNYLHFLNNRLTLVKIVFSPYLLVKSPDFDLAGRELFDNITKSILLKTDWDKYSHFAPNNEVLTSMVDTFLSKHFSISMEEIKKIIISIANKISVDIEASIIIQPLDDFIQLVSKVSGVSIEKIQSLIKISFLNIDNENHATRDFLRKNQQVRMLFNAGVIVDLDSSFKTMYDSRSAERKFVTSSKKHVIISPRLYVEWLDIFVTKIVLGQRNDLKNNVKLAQDIIDIETFYRMKVFEKEVTKMLSDIGFNCLNVAKIDGKDIECGEIDILAFKPETNELYIVECKAYAPIVDARGLGQVWNDHYKQKKYHKKFIRKIRWTDEHRGSIIEIFKSICNVPIDFKLNPYFITASHSALEFIENEYEIMTFYEFDNFLKNGTR